MTIAARLLLLVTVVASAPALAQVQRYDADKTRSLLLRLAKNPPKGELIIQGALPAGRKGEFLNYYSQVIFPRLQGSDFSVPYRSYSLLLDVGAARSKRELKWFQRRFEKVATSYSALNVDESWTEQIREWARLAQGLQGDLPDVARMLDRDRELESYAPHLKMKLDEVHRLESEYEMALNAAPSNARLPEYTQARAEIRRRFKAGEISLDQARSELRAVLMLPMGYHRIGFEAAQAKGENLNRMAVLRSQLAKAKGFPNWSAYTLEVSGQGYTAEYRGVENQRRFLKNLIAALMPIYLQTLDARIREMGLERADLDIRLQDLGFFSPPGIEQLRAYFPDDKITDIWQEVLFESGYSPEVLSQILVDDKIRKGKNTSMAYMSGFFGPYDNDTIVDAETLSFPPNPGPFQNPGFVYIMQTYVGGGLADLQTAFHEGGHGLERVLKNKTRATDEAYGYVEVPSMTSERYVSDPHVVFDKAVPVNGQRPTLEEVKTYITSLKRGKVLALIQMSQTALLDTELWAYDYSQPQAQTFLERIEQLTKETDLLGKQFPDIETATPLFYHNVSTTHYTSGNVRQIGYVYAEIASIMMAEHFSDRLETLTGRRSWHKQPLLAGLFEKELYSEGWKLPFPKNIEKITGRPYDVSQVVGELKSELGLTDGVCETILKPGLK